MLNQEDKKKVESYIKGTADDSERDLVESLFYSGENNEAFKELIRKDWAEFEAANDKKPDLNYILDKIHHDININSNLTKPTTIRRMIKAYARVAAILLIPLIISWGFLIVERLKVERTSYLQEESVSTEIFAPYGSRVSFNLPDGTKGMLNSGSRLSYSLPFKNNRNITLQGEGWFEVAEDKKNPFIINSGTSKVTVLGTMFNMSAYPNEKYVEVVLSEGKIRFSDSNISKEVIMEPSERLICKGGNIE
jgi:ferric-dicitrate binding protein FerR (iron transport regulator)